MGGWSEVESCCMFGSFCKLAVGLGRGRSNQLSLLEVYLHCPIVVQSGSVWSSELLHPVEHYVFSW